MNRVNISRPDLYFGALIFLFFTFLPVRKFSRDSAEGSVIKGVVLDGESHEPLENATVYLKDLELFDATDVNGFFEFKSISDGEYALEVSYLGYRKAVENVSVAQGKSQSLIIHIFPVAIQSQTIVITGEHPTTRFDDVEQSSRVLRGKELQRDLGQTLAATLRNETGIAVRSMGPAPARPVIRGFSGDRVAITEDGNNSADLSATSPDHAVSVEPFTIERIEVIRGPKLLLTNSSSIGGSVNIIRNEIPTKISPGITGNFGIYGESSNSGYLGAGAVEVPLGSFVLRGEGSRRSAEDQKTPRGVLKNSNLQTDNFSFGFGYINDFGTVGASVREFISDYGIPGGFVGAHPNGVNISMFKRMISAKSVINLKGETLENLEVDFARTYYNHTEFESSGLVGADFVIKNYEGNILFNTNNLGFFNNGAFGLNVNYRDYNVGGFVFNPPTRSYKIAAFVYESYSSQRVDFQIAARFNHDVITPESEYTSRIGYVRERNYTTYSLSGSALYEAFTNFYAGANLSRSTRTPTIEELFTEGPHLAAYSYETGNPELDYEQGIGMEFFVYYKNPSIFALATIFRNDFSYFIIPRNTGRINSQTLLPVYATEGVPAVIQGVEGQVDYRLTNQITFSSSISYSIGKITTEDSPLPMMPPLKGKLEIKYADKYFNAGVSVDLADAQTRLDLFEERTAGYAVANLFAQYTLAQSDYIHSFSVNIDNVFDKEYRNHLSRVKSIMPEAGRNFRATYRFYF